MQWRSLVSMEITIFRGRETTLECMGVPELRPSCQVLQLQLFPQIFKFWTPLLILALPRIVWIYELFLFLL